MSVSGIIDLQHKLRSRNQDCQDEQGSNNGTLQRKRETNNITTYSFLNWVLSGLYAIKQLAYLTPHSYQHLIHTAK